MLHDLAKHDLLVHPVYSVFRICSALVSSDGECGCHEDTSSQQQGKGRSCVEHLQVSEKYPGLHSQELYGNSPVDTIPYSLSKRLAIAVLEF